MGESVDEFMVTPSPPEGKRIRRCVQTKLSWGRPKENAGSPAADVREEIRKGEGTGKRNTKVKTPKKSPSTRAGRTRLSKSPGNGSCKRSKKNDAAGKSDIVKDLDIVCQNVERPACNLQLEAKLAHEENMVGKQMHPFFTCRKETKRLTESLDIQKLDKGGQWSIYASDDANIYTPFHIVDTQVEDISLDWSNWSFTEQAFGLSRCPMEEDCRRLVEPLKVDPVFLKARHTSLSSSTDINSGTATSTISNGQFQTQHQPPYPEAHLNNLSLSPRCGRLVGSLENCSQNGLDEERVLSYYRRPNDWSEHSLWTAKYQPENASEVCGNSHLVSQLAEWLKSWHEKGRKSDKHCNVEEQCVVENNEDRLYNAESDMEDQEDSLESVLLVTGPVGSGKSAAIHACAKEEGFEVIEVDASDLRNGTSIKNKYGEAMESHGFNRWSSYNNNNSRGKQNVNVLADAPCTMRNMKSENFGLTTPMDMQENDPSQCSWTGETRMANKSLVLFEDVDSVFDDDHGLNSFICTILQLAETSKRPIILTSNSKNRALTRLLGQLVLDFELPSNEELFRHVHTICANERAQISSCLLQQFISSCLGDLRKVIMSLQFWCQGKNLRIGSNILTYSPLHFDIDATHMVIPTAIPWEFKCELSEKILDEISRTLSSIEDNSVTVESDPLEKISSPNVGGVPKGITKNKKSKLKRKMSDPDSTNPANGNDLDDFSDASESLAGADLPRSNKKRAKRPRIILSSQSNDNLSADELPPADIMSSDVNDYPFVDTPTTMLELCSPLNSPAKFQRDDGCQYFLNSVDTASALHICDTFKLQDVSCVPDSCFLSGSEANKREDTMSVVVSSKNISGTLGDLVQSIHASQEQNNNLNRSITNRNLCPISNLYELDEGLGDSDNGIQELSCSGYQFMDECSQATFSIRSVPKRFDQNSPGTVSVQETWHKLHNQREELKKYVGESQRESLILNITSGLTDLIADSDIMFSGCYPAITDVLDPSLTPATEPDDFSWYDEQYEMGSTYSQHGLCHFMKHCDNACQDVGSIPTEPLMQEMLISSTNAMALGKLLALESTNKHDTSYGSLHMKETIHDISTRKTQSSLLDVLLPIVPARLSMILRGSAFHDYLSFSSYISKLESVRISEFSKEKGRRRSRSSQHYLSSSLTLPSKDLELLNRASCFKEALP
ncbi:uncharacterized protein LOC122034470 [Zingiber officinale]|uniref:uncharacterized protein LOC122034470 n=1 Tax=Zingiber officinale TaxID=94328 RepID=UPI001C4C50C1|nr:uncharacterized protein LOC122034470 [Zingiber officinale]